MWFPGTACSPEETESSEQCLSLVRSSVLQDGVTYTLTDLKGHGKMAPGERNITRQHGRVTPRTPAVRAVLPGTSSRPWKGKSGNGRQSLQITYLTRDLNPESAKNSDNSTMRWQTAQLKVGWGYSWTFLQKKTYKWLISTRTHAQRHFLSVQFSCSSCPTLCHPISFIKKMKMGHSEVHLKTARMARVKKTESSCYRWGHETWGPLCTFWEWKVCSHCGNV